MKRFRLISVFLLVTVVLLGSIGVTAFKHVCSKNGASISYFIPVSHHCKDEKKIAVDKKISCCKNNSVFSKSEVTIEKKPCCSNAVDYIYLDSDRTNPEPAQLNLSFEGSIFNNVFFINGSSTFINTCYRGPPPAPLLVTLAKLQTYII